MGAFQWQFFAKQKQYFIDFNKVQLQNAGVSSQRSTTAIIHINSRQNSRKISSSNILRELHLLFRVRLFAVKTDGDIFPFDYSVENIQFPPSSNQNAGSSLEVN